MGIASFAPLRSSRLRRGAGRDGGGRRARGERDGGARAGRGLGLWLVAARRDALQHADDLVADIAQAFA